MEKGRRNRWNKVRLLTPFLFGLLTLVIFGTNLLCQPVKFGSGSYLLDEIGHNFF